MTLTLEDALISDNLEEAYMLASYQNIPVFPVCGIAGHPRYKKPYTMRGYKDATTDLAQIKKWWSDHPDAMIGVPTGASTGLYVVDLDIKNDVDGTLSKNELEKELDVKLPETRLIQTGSGGFQLYYNMPVGEELGNLAGIRKGLDTRGNGGYVVYANSVNTAGVRYEVLHETTMADLPSEFVEFFKSKKSKAAIERDENGYIKEGTRNNSMAKIIGVYRGLGHEGQSLWELAKDYNEKFVSPSLDKGELEDIFESIGSRDRSYSHTPIGNGDRFADRYSGTVKCINGKGNATTWMIWDENKWSEDKLAFVKEHSKVIAEDLYAEATNLPDSDDMKAIKQSLYALAKATTNNPHKTLTMACSHPKIAVSTEQFDTHDYILPCRNGVIDLNTGEFSKHDPSLYYTKIVNASYSPDSVNSHWQNFISFFTGGDPEIEAYLARVYGGLGLIGANPQQIAIFLLGRAKNGKSTMNEIMQGILSDYSDILRTEVIGSRANKDFRHDVADLVGARFITVNELPRGMQINGSLFKAVTGGDTSKGRQNYQDSEKFTPKGLISMTSNWEPQLDDGDEGIDRRVVIYRHNDQVEHKDPKLKDKILAAPDAVLTWLINGRMDYLECCEKYEKGLISDPLNTPQKIKDMTEGFLNRRNPYRAFLLDECIITKDPKDSVKASDFYGAYFAYGMAQDMTRKLLKEGEFYEVCSNHFSKYTSDGVIRYKGIKMKSK